MKSLALFLFSGALALAYSPAQAQRTPSEATTAEQRLVEDIGTDRLPTSLLPATGTTVRNALTLLQSGTGNNATLDQRTPSTAAASQAYIMQVGTANVLGLLQNGGGNSAYMAQEGSGNRANLTQQGQGNSSTITQKGTNNRLDELVIGDSNKMNVYQDGNYNKVNSEIREDGRKYTISQLGNGNTLTQLETSSPAKGYGVEMRGNGINLIIEQGKVR